MIDLRQPEMAYMFGFIQSDGHMSESTRDRGRLSVELNSRDVDILEIFALLIPCNSSITHRVRDTNFKADNHSSVLTVCNLEFRTKLEELGLPYGNKGKIIALPLSEFSKPDYFRGLIDANGSLGLTSNGFPFFSLTTDSDNLAENYTSLIAEVCGKVKKCNRNTRDNVFNICVYKEDAQLLTQYLYYPNCVCLNRKRDKAEEVLNWVRPDDMVLKAPSKGWTEAEDVFIMQNSIECSSEVLNRSKSSIKNRIYRVNNNLTGGKK